MLFLFTSQKMSHSIYSNDCRYKSDRYEKRECFANNEYEKMKGIQKICKYIKKNRYRVIGCFDKWCEH